MPATGKLCAKHGGNCNPADASWLCDECARTGINKDQAVPWVLFNRLWECHGGLSKSVARSLDLVGTSAKIRSLFSEIDIIDIDVRSGREW